MLRISHSRRVDALRTLIHSACTSRAPKVGAEMLT